MLVNFINEKLWCMLLIFVMQTIFTVLIYRDVRDLNIKSRQIIQALNFVLWVFLYVYTQRHM